MDLGVIDIDGQDYWVWDGMERYRPRVMLVEHAAGTHDQNKFLKRDPTAMFIPEQGDSQKGQASFAAIVELGQSKGYTPLAVTHCNVLFCLTELVTEWQ